MLSVENSIDITIGGNINIEGFAEFLKSHGCELHEASWITSVMDDRFFIFHNVYGESITVRFVYGYSTSEAEATRLIDYLNKIWELRDKL